MLSNPMTPLERRAALSLAIVMSLRMVGLFMILPVFSLYTSELQGATPFLIGIAMGIYGLTQGLFQIPFGMLSDTMGRKKIIAVGLSFFVIGSVICAFSHNVYLMILGRAIQGTGAVGSAIMAMLADLTRENQRTKAMAILGMTIGLSFSLGMVAGPVFSAWFNIFWVAAFFGIAAIILLFLFAPTPQKTTWHADAEPELKQFRVIIKDPALLRLNAGIFLLHTILTASFVILPISLQNQAGLSGDQQWKLYFPILIFSFLFCLPVIFFAEKKKQIRFVFLSAIAALGLAEIFLWYFANHLLLSAASLLLFFTAFSTLEAFLPSLVSKTAPPAQKGTALGIYSCSQFLGIFVGGSAGGWLYGTAGLTNVYLFCAALAVLWVTIAFKMNK